MIVTNDKMYMYRRLTAVDAELNIKSSTIVAHLLAHSYSVALNMNVPIDFKCLYITCDFSANGSMVIDPDQIQLAMNGVRVTEDPVTITCENAWNFIDPSYITNWSVDRGFQQVIIGPINLIPEIILHTILQCFPYAEIFMYGDPLVDSPEYYNQHMNYLSNACLTVRVDYGVNRISEKKKVNNVLTKMRKDNTQLGDLSINTSVSVNNDNNINYVFIKQYLDEDPHSCVIVPKRLYSELNSALFYDLYGRDDLNPQVMETYMFKYPYTFKGHITFPDGSKTIMTIPLPAMTKFRIVQIYGKVINNYNNREYMRVDIQLMDNSILYDIMIDMDDFFLQFNPEFHPANMEVFGTIHETCEHTPTYFEFDPNCIKMCISRMVTSDQTKYFISTKTLDFIELIERNSHFGTDSNWFKHFCNTLDEIDIIYCDEF